MSAARAIAVNALVALLTLGLCVGFAEGVVRVVMPQETSWLAIYRRVPELPFYTLERDLDVSIVTGTTRMHVRTDADGFRVPTAGPAATGTVARPLLLALGDSFTFGQGVDYEETFVAHLERAWSPPHRVLDAGIGGHGPREYRRYAEHLIAGGMRPDVMVVGVYVGNDFGDCLWSKDLPIVDGIIGGEHSLRAWIKRNVHLYRLASKVYQSRFAPQVTVGHVAHRLYEPAAWEEGELAQAWPVFREEMTLLGALAARVQSKLLVVVIPTEAAVAARVAGTSQTAVVGGDLDLPVRRVMALLDELAIPAVDLTPALATQPTDQVYLRIDGHLTPLGNRLAGEAIVARGAQLP